jgi:LemA protein
MKATARQVRSWAVALAVVLATSGCGYNRIQELDESAKQMQGNIDTELQRRSDLIPNLVATVDEAASHEKEVQVGVAEARSGVNAARDKLSQALAGGSAANQEAVAAASADLDRQLSLFMNISVEAYPELRANENFLRLQDELTETENRINVARRDYNETVATYNTYIRRFPQNLTAKVIGAKQRETFEAPESAREAPKVQFPG